MTEAKTRYAQIKKKLWPYRRERILKDIHAGNQSESKRKRRACGLVWWPGVTAKIRELVKGCPKCEEFKRIPKEPMQTTTESICRELEDIFCMLGIPHTFMSDNAAQFKGNVFSQFLRRWDIEHITSSPRHPQSNGATERAMATPLINRELDSAGIFTHKPVAEKRMQKKEMAISLRQKVNYNVRHATRDRSPFQTQQTVRIQEDPKKPARQATVIAMNGKELSLQTENGSILHRNRCKVHKMGRPPDFLKYLPSDSLSGYLLSDNRQRYLLPDSRQRYLLPDNRQRYMPPDSRQRYWPPDPDRALQPTE
ncbi:uncharacterized protein [Watersipora subatra]|uniref:uncharacterized protein n=1 Tax=Watersipora subatra TaxID=2589382 RepID=UPI00355C46EE